jgi:hypothetical protein
MSLAGIKPGPGIPRGRSMSQVGTTTLAGPLRLTGHSGVSGPPAPPNLLSQHHLRVVDTILRFLFTCACQKALFSRAKGPRRLTPEAKRGRPVNQGHASLTVCSRPSVMAPLAGAKPGPGWLCAVGNARCGVPGSASQRAANVYTSRTFPPPRRQPAPLAAPNSQPANRLADISAPRPRLEMSRRENTEICRLLCV